MSYGELPSQVRAAEEAANAAMRAPDGTPSEPATAPAAQPVSPAPQPTQVVATADSSEASRMEQRYRVLQGKYNSEVGALSETVKSLKAEIEAMRTAVQNPPAAPIMLEEFEAHGPEIQKLAQTVREQAETIAALRSQLTSSAPQAAEERVHNLEEAVMREREERYFDALERSAPGWQKINNMPEFHSWLNQVEPASGEAMMVLIKRAAGVMNARQVSWFFNEFKKAARLEIQQEGDVLPRGQGQTMDMATAGRFNPEMHATREQLRAAQADFQQGRISEADYDKVASKFQRAVRDGLIG